MKEYDHYTEKQKQNRKIPTGACFNQASQFRLLEEDDAVLKIDNDDLLLRVTIDLDPDPDAMDPDDPLKHPNSLMIRPANPPPPPPLLDPHANLL